MTEPLKEVSKTGCPCQAENERIKDLVEALKVTTQLARVKWGNLDKGVYEEIKKAEALIDIMEAK